MVYFKELSSTDVNTPKGKELKMKDLRSPEVQKMTDAEMYKVIAKGKRRCQVMKQVWANRLVMN
jgi:hypothetical protein